ncbi:MAG: SDR family NAD(P)-dependent oxidoreductase, partial [Acidimicrobiia bacterium]|nr:SDR family NAD(P)-dependent oxidoreductase [Acidimicrobiia bacterium]
MDFNGKTAVITGGATGIGFAVAKALGADGSRIVVAEPRREKLDEA